MSDREGSLASVVTARDDDEVLRPDLLSRADVSAFARGLRLGDRIAATWRLGPLAGPTEPADDVTFQKWTGTVIERNGEASWDVEWREAPGRDKACEFPYLTEDCKAEYLSLAVLPRMPQDMKPKKPSPKAATTATAAP